MESTGLNTLDIIVISLQFLSAVIAFFRGFVREILSLGAWVGAFIVAVYCMDPVAAMLAPHIPNPLAAKGAAALGVYLLTLITISIINMFILRAVHDIDIGFLDRSVGFVFGLLRGIFIVALAHLTFSQLVAEKDYPEWFTEAKTRTLIELSSSLLAAMAPEYTHQLTEITEKAKQGGVEGVPMDGLQAAALESILKESAPRGLPQKDRETLRLLLGSLPADRLLYYASELARAEAAVRPSILANIVTTARKGKTAEELFELELSQQQLDSLEKALAKSTGSGSDARLDPGYGDRQVKDMDRLIEGLQ